MVVVRWVRSAATAAPASRSSTARHRSACSLAMLRLWVPLAQSRRYREKRSDNVRQKRISDGDPHAAYSDS